MSTNDDSRLAPRGRRFVATLATWPRRKVTLMELWRILDEADPASRMASSRRQLLLTTLNDLAEEGVVDMPAASSWDRSETPHLPRFVRLRSTDKQLTMAPQVVWHHALAWVPDGGVPATHRPDLIKINRWFHSTRTALVVPTRERSLEIFGHEKTLDRLQRTSLFAPGRLTLDLLRTRRSAPRFTHEVVGTGGILLVVENSDTFDSLTHVLARSPGDVGAVGWGSGGGFEASVLSSATLPNRPERILYFGDIDLRGLTIPANASRNALAAGLPPVEPATSLYRALLDRGQRQTNTRVSPTTAQEAASWLPANLRDPVVAVLTGGKRIAQEDVGVEYLTDASEWRLSLT